MFALRVKRVLILERKKFNTFAQKKVTNLVVSAKEYFLGPAVAYSCEKWYTFAFREKHAIILEAKKSEKPSSYGVGIFLVACGA